MALYETLIEGGHEHLIDAVKARIAQKADAIVEDELKPIIENQPSATIDGELLVADDAADLPPVMVGVDGHSTQDGTPTPENPVPIEIIDAPTVTLAGKNLCPTADGTTIASDWVREGQNYIKYIGLTVENATLTLSCNMAAAPSVISTSNNRLYVTIPGAQSKFCNLNTAGAKSATVSGSGIVRLGINRNAIDSNGVDTLLKDIQLEIGSTATAYEPYACTTVSLYDGALRSLPDGTKDTLAVTYLRPSTREGWAWYAPMLTKSCGFVDLGELSWSSYSHGAYQKFQASLPDILNSWSKNVGYCTCYATGSAASISATIRDNTIVNHATHHAVLARDPRFVESEDAVAFTAAVAGQSIVYRLTTPTTEALDPIELPVLPAPTCTVWADPTADLKLTYVIDSKTIEESLESGIGKAFSSVAPVETSPATDNHDAGSRIVYNETLYKVTSAIAAGEDIVLGTNVTATTVAAELLATQA